MTWMLTAGGRVVDLLRLDPATIDARDIAHHLAQINRYCGACSRPYSVAEHSLLVVEILERELGEQSPSALLAALMHDAHEAYTQDVTQPMKQLIGSAWREAEDRIQHQVLARFGLLTAWAAAHARVHWADMVALVTERAQLMPPEPPWPAEAVYAPVTWADLGAQAHFGWTDWRRAWLDRYHELKYAQRLQRVALYGAATTDPLPTTGEPAT